jgi:hypothetical protein
MFGADHSRNLQKGVMQLAREGSPPSGIARLKRSCRAIPMMMPKRISSVEHPTSIERHGCVSERLDIVPAQLRVIEYADPDTSAAPARTLSCRLPPPRG